MKNFVLLAALFGAAFFVYAEEVSVFGGGSVNSGVYNYDNQPSDYNNNTNKSNDNYEPAPSETQESIDGIRSLLDGINANNRKLNSRIDDLENSVKASDFNVSEEISALKALIEQNKIEQDEKIRKLAAAIGGGSAIVDSKSAQSSKSVKKSNDDQGEGKVNSDDKGPADVLVDADKFYKDKNYDKARDAYATLVKKNHKPAYSNYMLGEVAYATKNYKDAIPYYQNSVSLNGKANYMPRLLYHTAISLDKIGDTANANKFYQALKQAYPDSKEAKAAPSRK